MNPMCSSPSQSQGGGSALKSPLSPIGSDRAVRHQSSSGCGSHPCARFRNPAGLAKYPLCQVWVQHIQQSDLKFGVQSCRAHDRRAPTWWSGLADLASTRRWHDGELVRPANNPNRSRSGRINAELPQRIEGVGVGEELEGGAREGQTPFSSLRG